MTQAAGLRLELRTLSIVVSHCYTIFSSWFGEAPDEDGGHGGTTVQRDWASHCCCSMGANVFHLLWVQYLQTCNTRQSESVTITVRKEKLLYCFPHIDKNSLHKPSIDRCLLVNVFRKLLQDLTVCLEWTASAFEEEQQHIIIWMDLILWPSLWLHLAIWHNNDSSLW